ncbi:Aquaporin-B [Durusdinium trenchii]|uniref:Aquaporin-B n=1 Tax=Durusdinium trenchii TaxID=1381693 RepID=A0ABP0S8D8_9DINO
MLLATLAGNFNSVSGFEAKNACFLHQAGNASPAAFRASDCVKPEIGDRSGHWSPECPSKRSYHAETVSEMVSKSDYPAAKLFFSFTLIGSLSLLLSKYPWELRNVYLGGTVRRRVVTALRAVVPPVGMLIVCTIPVAPRVRRTDLATQLACNVHNLGACLYVGGYNALEAITLRILWPKLDSKERLLRSACVGGGLFCTFGFLFAGALYTTAKSLGICCMDEYEATAAAFRRVFHLDNSTTSGRIDEVLAVETFGPYVLVNSANQTALALKKAEFWMEEFAGFFVLTSHLLIWLFAVPIAQTALLGRLSEAA